MPVRVASHYKAPIRIDGDILKLKIKRLNREEWIAFASEFERMQMETRGAELLLDRRPGEEALSEDDVEAKRLMELPPFERDEFIQKRRDESTRQTEFGVASITSYVSVDGANELFDEDADRYVTDGADIVRLYSQRHDVLSTIIAEIFLQNRLSENAKKNLQLLRASRAGSDDRSKAPGETPVPTAASAESADSAPSAPAADLPGHITSGSMDPSS